MKNEHPRSNYLAPSIEVFEMDWEGVIADSNGDFPSVLPNESLSSRSRHTGYDANIATDIEEMINNIFTE